MLDYVDSMGSADFVLLSISLSIGIQKCLRSFAWMTGLNAVDAGERRTTM
jgi:hypothetical protein